MANQERLEKEFALWYYRLTWGVESTFCAARWSDPASVDLTEDFQNIYEGLISDYANETARSFEGARIYLETKFERIPDMEAILAAEDVTSVRRTVNQ